MHTSFQIHQDQSTKLSMSVSTQHHREQYLMIPSSLKRLVNSTAIWAISAPKFDCVVPRGCMTEAHNVSMCYEKAAFLPKHLQLHFKPVPVTICLSVSHVDPNSQS